MASESASAGRRPLRIGKYEVQRHIATGGMGAVYRALDTDLNRPVALKVLSPELAVKPAVLERFRREARSAAKLRHDNIVSIYEFGESNGTYFLALEFVDGIDLHEYICRQGKLDPEEARQIVLQAAKALDHAHKTGIVHRDIKPANFLITKKGDQVLVKLTDLGLAREVNEEEFRVTKAGTTVGTIDYMAPEQARNSSAADIRSDIYALGCTFYHMLVGHCPFPEGSLTERIYQHVEAEPRDVRQVSPSVPEGLMAILQKMMAKKPEDRYQTPLDLIKDLEHPEKLRVYLSERERLASLAELAAFEAAPAPRRPSPQGEEATAATPGKKLRSAAGRRFRDQGDNDETALSASTERLPSWTLWAVAALGVAVVLGVVIWQMQSSPSVKKDPEAKVQLPAPVMPDPTAPGFAPAARSDKNPVGPPEPKYPLLYKLASFIDGDQLRPEFYGPFTQFPTPEPGAVVFRVGRAAIPGPDSFRSLGEALLAAPLGKPALIEIHDNGPLFEPSVPALADRQIFVRPGPGYRPLIAWDLAAEPAGPSASKQSFLPLTGGRLVVENLDLVVRWDREPSAEPACFFDVAGGVLFAARGCTFSVAGRHPAGVILARVQPAKSDTGKVPAQCRFSRCFARGADLIPLSVGGGDTEILFDGCLLVGRNQPLLQVAGTEGDRTNLRLVRSTLVAGHTLFRLQPTVTKILPAKVNCLAWDALLARSDPKSDGSMVVADEFSLAGLSWRPVNCLYAGWRNLLAAGPRTLASGALESWRTQFVYSEGDLELSTTWPAKAAAQPEDVSASAYASEDTPACFAATSGPGTLGCSLGALPAAPRLWRERTHEHYPMPSISLPDRGVVPAIPFANDGLYHGERVDLSKTDLGQLLDSRMQMFKSGPEVVLHLAGVGECPTSPVRVQRMKKLILYFEPPKGKLEPLTLVPDARTAEGRDALIEVDGGSLELIGARVKFANSKFATIPARVLSVRGGDLVLHSCRLQGPLNQAPDDFQGLIRFQTTTAPEAACRFVVNESALLSAGTVIHVQGRAGIRCKQSVLLADGDLFHLEPGPSPELQVVLEQNTIATRGTVFTVSDVHEDGATADPVVFQATGNLFLDPFDGPRQSALLRVEGRLLPRGLLLWQGRNNAFDKRCQAFALLAPNEPSEKQEFKTWTRLWGTSGEQQALLLDIPAHPKSTFKVSAREGPLWESLVLPPQLRSTLASSPGADLVRLGLLKR
jgi:hypothetical protein